MYSDAFSYYQFLVELTFKVLDSGRSNSWSWKLGSCHWIEIQYMCQELIHREESRYLEWAAEDACYIIYSAF